MKQTRHNKVACAAEQHALHWKRFALSVHTSVGGFNIQEDYVATLQRTQGQGFVSPPESELF